MTDQINEKIISESNCAITKKLILFETVRDNVLSLKSNLPAFYFDNVPGESGYKIFSKQLFLCIRS